MELLVAMMVVGILLSIALPGYKEYQIRANKSAVKAAMQDIASRQEQYMMNAGKYTCANPATSPVDSDQAPTCTYVVPADGRLALIAYTVPTEVIRYFDITLVAGTNTASSVVALQGLPTFTVTASGKAGTVQADQPAAGATALSINQFGLKLPLTEW